MIDTLSVGSEKSDGLQKLDFQRLRPWDVAEKLLPTENGQSVDVEHATDEQFQTFIARIGLPVDDAGIEIWTFDDRCRAINHALKYGLDVPFVEPENSSEDEQKESESELFQVV